MPINSWMLTFFIYLAINTGHASTIESIIALSPHSTELVHSAGAGAKLKGVDKNSNYPTEVLSLPKIGNATGFDIEKILTLEPDLVVGWKSGTPQHLIKILENLDIPLILSEPKTLDDITNDIMNIANLTKTIPLAQKNIEQFKNQIEKLKNTYSHKSRVKVFYQVWHQPLMTLNKQHFVSKVINLCGGTNIFADLSTLAPKITLESVIQQNPKVIVLPTPSDKDFWTQWKAIDAVKNNQFIVIDPDKMQRPTLRLAQAAQSLCQALDKFR